jgi:Spy/CpxP family protein refolding chaperone
MVDAYVISNLQESVGLSDEQFVKVLPLVKRFQADRREAAQGRRRALHEMRAMLQAGDASAASVAEKLREVKAFEGQEADQLRRNTEAIDAVLTPVQQAKFRVMQIEVEQKIREILQEGRQRRRGDRPPP